jgi:GT2 family glycosyltransferase
MDPLKNIAVLMTCHNRVEKTLKCLEHLFAALLPEGHVIEVFLVDDGSTDGTGDQVRDRFPQVYVIQGDGHLFWNRGMIRAWETAVKHRPWDYFLWLNDDTFLFEDAIDVMIKSRRRFEGSCIICGTILSADHENVNYGGREKNGQIIESVSKCAACDLINGNCVLVPDSVYDSVGMLDPCFHHAIGDFDYGLRAKKCGVVLAVSQIPVAVCEKNQAGNPCFSESVSLLIRIKSLYSPLGCDPKSYFVYDCRHFGIASAIKHFISIHFRALFPALWGRLKGSIQ